MKLKSIFISLILVVSLMACGGKKSTTRTSLVLGGVIDSIATQAGGTMIYGRQISGGSDNFAIKLPYSEDLILTNGLWRFAVVSWDGNGGSSIMEGQTRCGLSEVDLLGGNQTVSMSLSSANCFAQFFGDDASKEVNGQPKVFLPTTCALLDQKRGRIDNNQCQNSVGTSFKVELPQKLPGGSFTTGLVSACVDETTLEDEYLYDSTSNLRIPMFFNVGSSEPFIKLSVYEGPGCTGSLQETLVSNPLAGIASRSIELEFEDSTHPTLNVFYVHNPVCEGSYLAGATPFDIDGASAGTDYILCNPTHFAAINSDVNGNYYLDHDLDYFNEAVITGPIVSSPFTGTFDGRGHTVFDIMMDAGISDLGMFTAVSGRVSNLSIVSADLSATVGDRGNLGVLVGNLTGGGVIENISLSDISIELSGAGSRVGSLIGYVNNTVGSGGVRNIFAKNIYLDITGYTEVGGVIGHIDGANSRVSDISVDYVDMIFDNVTGGCLGGVYGISRLSSFVENISMEGIYIGDNITPSGGASRDNIGGIVGCAASGSTLKSARVSGEIYTASNSVGGAVGFVDPTSGTPGHVYIKDVLSSVGIITGDSRVGGVVGEALGDATASLKMQHSRYIGPVGSGYINCVDKCAGLVANLGGTGTVHEVNKSWARDLDVESTAASGATIGGLVATGQDATLNSVFGDNVSLTTQISFNTVGGLYGLSAGVFSITDAYFIGDIYGDTSGDDGLITSNAMNANLINIYTIGSATRGGYGLGTPTTATNLYSTVAGNITQVAQSVIEDSSTLQGVGFTSGIWENLTNANTKKTFNFEIPYVKFANSGLGTHNDPYLVSSVASWNAIGDKPEFMGKAFKLVANLDFNSIPFTPIGSVTNPFWGNLSGNNYSISNINEPSCTAPFGLISVISTDVANTNADFARNVGINNLPESGTLYLYDNTMNCTGGHVGTLIGEARDRLGAAVNDNRYAIAIKDIVVDGSNLSTTGNTPVSGAVGGVIGRADLNNVDTQLKNISVYNSPAIYAGTSSLHSGGLFGSLESTSGTAPTNDGRVESLKSIGNTVSSAGGVIGTGGVFGYFSAKHVEARKIIADSSVSGDQQVGGVVGSQMDGRIAEAVSVGEVSGTTNVGGFVGYLGLAAAEISGSYSTASVTATTDGSGFVGNIIAGATIDNSWYDPVSLSGAAVLFAPSDISGAGSNLVYVGTVDANAGTTHATLSELQSDQVFFSANFLSIDPFIFSPGDYPRPYFEVFPQFFND